MKIGASASLHPYVFLALAFILAGSSVIPGKALSGLPPFFTAAASAAIGLVVLIGPALAEAAAGRRSRAGGEDRHSGRAMLRALPLLAAQAFFGLALFRVLILAALARTGAAEVGIATSATPAATAILAAIFLKEAIGSRKILGIALVVGGVSLLESSAGAGAAAAADAPSAAEVGARLAGLGLALGAAFSESIFNVMAKRIPSALGPRTTSAAVTALALAMLAIAQAASGERVDLSMLDAARIAALAYYGVFASALAYLCWYRGIKEAPASTAGAFSGFMPLSGFVLSILIFGERPGLVGAIGAVLAVGGMTLCAIVRRGT